jgi:glycosyltransferase involved in cell wall biosynthesis
MSSSDGNKVLIITYYWPPSGGAGVQRWLKFSKYLPEYGWEPIILTVDPEYAAYPVTDFSLGDDLPSSIKVYTTPATNYFSIYRKDKSKIPTAGFANNIDNSVRGKIFRFVRGNFFLPDPRRGWNKFALRKASELIKKEGITHIVTTSPPHSTQLIGLKLKEKFPGIKWIADLRDPWTDIYYYKQFYPTILSKAIDERYEKSVLRRADKIITVGESLKAVFSLKGKEISEKTFVVTNGYDEADFNLLPAIIPAKLTITYVGTLSEIYPVEGLVNALNKLAANGKDFTMRFVGTISDKSKELLLADIPPSYLEFLPYVAHNEAIRYMMGSSFLILIIPLHISNKSIITGKLFEYIASGVPIAYIGPQDGDAAHIIRSASSGNIFNYNESDLIYEFFVDPEKPQDRKTGNERLKYSREYLTGIISDILIS